VRIINCARGGLIDEAALKAGLESGHIGGAALDVFVEEPAKESPLFGTPNFISTPHLGASTSEAQVNVAIQVAEQMADFLVSGGVTNALNVPSLSAEEAPRLKPYMALAEKLGSLVGQLAHGARIGVAIDSRRRRGRAQPEADHQRGAGRADARPFGHGEHGQRAVSRQGARAGRARSAPRPRRRLPHLLRVTVKTEAGERSVAGTLFSNAQPRLVELFGIKVEADLVGNMLYVVNEDAPGFIGRLGTALGEAGVNIGTFHLGRRDAGGEAVLLLSLDDEVTPELIAKVRALPGVKTAMALKF
jgi:D-3-phosphoglycerate dehydrogenase